MAVEATEEVGVGVFVGALVWLAIELDVVAHATTKQ